MFKNIANMDSFLREEDLSTTGISFPEGVSEKTEVATPDSRNGFMSGLCVVAALVMIAGGLGYKSLTTIDTSEGMFSGLFHESVLNDIQPESSAITAANSKREIISIERKITKNDPFLPYREIADKLNAPPKLELVEPPSSANEDSEAGRIMDTSVSGILYDTYSPSAIINIEGLDQLVKKGDVVSNYQIIDIDKNTVTVKLGNNTYTAGIGEILTSNRLHHNKVSNLDKKFGGKNSD